MSSAYDQTNVFYYDGGWRVLAEYRTCQSQTSQWDYIYGNYLDEVLMVQVGNVDYYYAHDHLYSPVALLEDDGTVLERYEYDAYGRLTAYTDDGEDDTWFTGDDAVAGASDRGNVIAFTGQRLDVLDYLGHLKLMYYKNRYYDGEVGRFLTRDPIGYQDGMNLYQYVQSAPIYGLDPKGLINCNTSLSTNIGSPMGLLGFSPGIQIMNIFASNEKLMNLLKAMAAAAPSLRYAPVLACKGNHPCEHCVWSCRMARAEGEEYATDMGYKKEAVDDAFADLADTISDAEWEKLPTFLRKYMSDWVCSANQDSDIKDNAAGRDCGCNHQEMSCEDCCSTEYNNGPDNPQPEGPDTGRPFGKRCQGRYLKEQEDAKKKNKGGGITVTPGWLPPDLPIIPSHPELPPRIPIPKRPWWWPEDAQWPPPVPGWDDTML